MFCVLDKLLFVTLLIHAASSATISNSSSISSTITSAAATSSLDLAWLRSPQCTSSYQAFLSAGGAYNENACCGTCSIYWQKVDVNYFPATNANYGCLKSIDPYWSTATDPTYPQTRIPDNTGNIPIPYPTSAVPTITAAPPLVRRDNNSEIQTAVGPDGFTYSSPYIYVVFQTISALDQCGARGGFYTSLTWSFLPGQISTVEGRMGPTKSFDIADLPCPPSAVASADWYNYKPGEPYRPILAPMPQLWELDPLFKECVVDIYEGFDPPHALTPQAQIAITTSAVIPIKTPTPSGPSLITLPTVSDLPADGVPTSESGPTLTPEISKDGDPITMSNADPTPSLPTITAIPPSQTNTPVVIGSETVSVGPSAIVVGSQTLSPGSQIVVGTNTISLAPSSSAIVVDGSTISIAASSSASSFSVGGQVITSQSGGFVVDGQTLSAGGSAVTVSGTTLSLASNSLVVGSTTYALPSAGTTDNTQASATGPTITGSASGISVGLGQLIPATLAVVIAGCMLL